jgi:hypothetical protein
LAQIFLTGSIVDPCTTQRALADDLTPTTLVDLVRPEAAKVRRGSR